MDWCITTSSPAWPVSQLSDQPSRSNPPGSPGSGWIPNPA